MEKLRPERQLVIDARNGRTLSNKEVREYDERISQLKNFVRERMKKRLEVQKFPYFVESQIRHANLLKREWEKIESQEDGRLNFADTLKAAYRSIETNMNLSLMKIHDDLIIEAIHEFPDFLSGSPDMTMYHFLKLQDLPEYYLELDRMITEAILEKVPEAEAIFIQATQEDAPDEALTKGFNILEM